MMFVNRWFRVFAVIALLVSSLSLSASVTLAKTTPSVSNVYTFTDPPVRVKGGMSQLLRRDGAVRMHINTKDLIPGNAYTIWWVVFNDPAQCFDGCGEDDIGVPESSGLWATGFVSSKSGGANAHATLEEGIFPGQVLFGPGLTDAQGAEIHLVVRDHGPPQPDLLDAQIGTFGGGCNNVPEVHPGYDPDVVGDYACDDVQFAVHMP